MKCRLHVDMNHVEIMFFHQERSMGQQHRLDTPFSYYTMQANANGHPEGVRKTLISSPLKHSPCQQFNLLF